MVEIDELLNSIDRALEGIDTAGPRLGVGVAGGMAVEGTARVIVVSQIPNPSGSNYPEAMAALLAQDKEDK